MTAAAVRAALSGRWTWWMLAPWASASAGLAWVTSEVRWLSFSMLCVLVWLCVRPVAKVLRWVTR